MALPLYLNGRLDLVTLWPAGAAVILMIVPGWHALRGRLLEAAISAILLEALILAPTLQIIIPNTDGLWLSRSVARAVEHHSGSAGKAPPIIAAAGYHEPSLVFLCGTGTKLVGPSEAASYLRQNPEGLALVREKLDAEFHEAISGPNNRVQLLERIHGFNYTKGKQMTLFLYGSAE